MRIHEPSRRPAVAPPVQPGMSRARRRHRPRPQAPLPRARPTSRRRHLRAHTAQRALQRNLDHLQARQAEPWVPPDERVVLQQSIEELTAALDEHHTLRTRMASVILG